MWTSAENNSDCAIRTVSTCGDPIDVLVTMDFNWRRTIGHAWISMNVRFISSTICVREFVRILRDRSSVLVHRVIDWLRMGEVVRVSDLH